MRATFQEKNTKIHKSIIDKFICKQYNIQQFTTEQNIIGVFYDNYPRNERVCEEDCDGV